MSESKNIQLEESWLEVLQPEFEKPYFKQLKLFLQEEKKATPYIPTG